jgi:hypothetical protein
VCDLPKCDFWQCSFKELPTLEAWAAWEQPMPLLVAVQPQPKEYSGVRKGLFVITQDDKPVYPPRLYADEWQYSAWLHTVVSVGVKRVVYWVLEDAFNQPIARDREWFEGEALPELRRFWDEVLNLRSSGPASFDLPGGFF